MQVSTVEQAAVTALDYHCPAEAILDVIGGKRKVVILFYLTLDGTQRKIPGVSERMLTQQLRELEHAGIVHREVYPEVPPKVEYSLTDYGQTLRPITEIMSEWGKRHIKQGAAK
jgi:DNA-binding HxlR family transcriptional regulator